MAHWPLNFYRPPQDDWLVTGLTLDFERGTCTVDFAEGSPRVFAAHVAQWQVISDLGRFLHRVHWREIKHAFPHRLMTLADVINPDPAVAHRRR